MREPRTGSSGLFGHRKVGTSVQALLISDLRRAARGRSRARPRPQLQDDRPDRGRAGHQALRPQARRRTTSIAMNGEAGYQRDLLMPGLRFKLWPVFSVAKYPWVQVPAGEIGVVIAQVGAPLPIGAKSARLQAGVRRLQRRRDVPRRRRPEGRAAAGAAAGHARADPSGRVPRGHLAARCTAMPVSTDSSTVAAERRARAGELRADAGAAARRR